MSKPVVPVRRPPPNLPRRLGPNEVIEVRPVSPFAAARIPLDVLLGRAPEVNDPVVVLADPRPASWCGTVVEVYAEQRGCRVRHDDGAEYNWSWSEMAPQEPF